MAGGKQLAQIIVKGRVNDSSFGNQSRNQFVRRDVKRRVSYLNVVGACLANSKMSDLVGIAFFDRYSFPICHAEINR